MSSSKKDAGKRERGRRGLEIGLGGERGKKMRRRDPGKKTPNCVLSTL